MAYQSETEMLLDYLNGQRRHVLGILDGLDDAALRRPALPSGWHCLAVVRHLARDVERFWFRAVVAGDQALIKELGEGEDDGWLVDPDTPAEEVLEAYRRETALADEVITGTPLDTPPAWTPERGGGWMKDDLREVILHVIAETTTHAGHLDAARELIDGRQWRVLTE